ncbi:hypothetical protein GCM10020220_000110 [Nonomuraea rubra]
MSPPSHAATGTLANATADTVLQASITGRFGIRSTHAPAGSPATSHGDQAGRASAGRQ